MRIKKRRGNLREKLWQFKKKVVIISLCILKHLKVCEGDSEWR